MDRVLMICPGPTMVPDPVTKAGTLPMVNHRGAEFSETLTNSVNALKTLLGTDGDAFIFAGSGRAAVEAAIVNSMSPGDKILVPVNGFFGLMLETICREMGCTVVPVCPDWTRPVDPQGIADALKRDGAIKTVAMVHNETSTGVVNDIVRIAEICHVYGCLLVVDAVSSAGGMPINMDAEGIDVVATGSQKCLMCPPGLAIVAVRKAAWHRIDEAKLARFYLDLRRMKEYANRELPQTPGTTPVSLVRCLHEALGMILDEGSEAVYMRHARMAKAIRLGVQALGLSMFPDEPAQSSPTVVTVGLPVDLKPSDLMDVASGKYGLVLGSGLGKLAQSTIRIGTMGAAARDKYVLKALELLGRALADLQGIIDASAGTEAACEFLSRGIR